MGQKQSRNAGDEYSGAAEDDRSTKLLDVTLHNEESNEQAQTCRSTLWELWKLTKLAVPIFIMQVSWSGMTLTDTALLGHVGTVYLNSQALQTLVTNSTGVLLTSRVLVVFGKQSFAAGKSKLVGVWTQVALFVQTLMAVAVAIIWSLAGPILRLGGASDELIWPAWYYALVLAACLPARVILYSFNQFFQSQGKLYPGVICSLMALAINLLAGLIFVLGIPFNPNPNFNPNATAEMNSTRTGGFGFEACPVVTSSTEWLQVIALLSVFVGCYHLADECWPGKGLSWAHILSRNPKGQRRICEFLKMWLPATLSVGSDYWRMMVIGIVAASIGNDQLGAFNASYRIAWVCLVLSGSVAYAAGLKVGEGLGANNPRAAKASAIVGIVAGVVIAAAMGTVVAVIPRTLASILSNDEKLLDIFEEIRYPFAAVVALMNCGSTLDRIAISIGKAKAVLIVGLIGSWLGQVPGVLLLTFLWRRDLVGLFTGMAAGYVVVVCAYALVLIRTDWDTEAKDAQQRTATAEDIAASDDSIDNSGPDHHHATPTASVN